MKHLLKLVPEEYNTYYEPFLGGGALLFELKPKRAIINDYNIELINTYKCIKDKNKLKLMCEKLKEHETNNSEEYFYKIRSLDRNKSSFYLKEDYIRAARTIYLNKACFNGLYRVNKNNEFNSPYGKKEKIITYEEDNLQEINSYFNDININILNVDYEEALKTATKGDFIYLDPPYDSNTPIFNKYTSIGFDKQEQIRLSNVFKELDKRGCFVMLSNYNTEFINDLYSEYNIHHITSKTTISAKVSSRGSREELIITNY